MSAYNAADFERAEFARHPDGGIAARVDLDDQPWAASVPGETCTWETDGQMARGGWSPVRECPNPDLHDIVMLSRTVAAVTQCSCSAQRARAQRAEQERDQLRERLAGATLPVPDVTITDEMVKRAWTALLTAPGWTVGTLHEDAPTIRRALTAALTEPPKRPRGAEAFDPIVDAAIRGHSDISSPDVVHAISDALAKEGVRTPEGSGR